MQVRSAKTATSADCRLSAAVVFVGVVCLCVGTVRAQEKRAPPPYQIVGSQHVLIGVQWDEAAVKRVLPKGITPVKDARGLINIYRAGNSYGFGPYSAAYFTVDVEGFDSTDGSKGRWMIAGAYGPQEKMALMLKEFYGLPVRSGSSRLEPTSNGVRGIATVAGSDVVVAEIKSKPETCKTTSGMFNYLGVNQHTGQVVINQIPGVGDFCEADPISVKITAPAGDPFAAFEQKKVLWAGEFKNGSFSFSRPVPQP